MDFPFDSVNWAMGSDNMGGVSTTIYLIPAECVKAMPGPAGGTDDTNLAEGQFELEDGAKWVEVYATYESPGIKSAAQGSHDGHSYKVTGEFFHPGETADMARLARAINNTPCLYVVPDNEGKRRLIGTPTHPCVTSVSHDTGKKAADRKGWTIKFETSAVASHVYLGEEVVVKLS